MISIRTLLLLATALNVCSFSSTNTDVVLEKKSNYNSWGTAWDTVFVLKNSVVTLAIVPKIGGRIMQYDLGSHPSIYIHEQAKGKIPDSGDSLIGGFRMLPSPQEDFEWPSPPKVDYGTYTCTTLKNTPDSVVLLLESPIENSTLDKYISHKGLQFKRKVTLYSGSTKVRVQMTMLNKGTQAFKHGIWDITQSSCVNNGAADLKNFWVYFQRNANSTLGKGKGYVQYSSAVTDTTLKTLDSTQWKPSAGDGNIMGVQFLQKIGKIGADCKAGWISFTDRLDAYAYVKTFMYEEGKTYPDSGASIQVYTYKDYNMLEVEVLGPLVNLAPGDSTTFTEVWYAARTLGPVLNVTPGGLCTRRLTVQQKNDTLQMSGCFGIFAAGTVKYQFCSATGAVLGTPDSASVNPSDSFVVSKSLKITPNTTSFRLAAYDKKGTMISTIDSVAVPQPVGVVAAAAGNIDNSALSLRATNSRIRLTLPRKGSYLLSIHNPEGKLMYTKKLTVGASGSIEQQYPAAVPGIYMIHVSGEGIHLSELITITCQK